jgi:choline dehydrogenase
MLSRLLTEDKKTSVIAIDRGSWLADDTVITDNVNLTAPVRRPKNDDIYEFNEQSNPNGLLGNFNIEIGKGGPGGCTNHYFGNCTRGQQWDEWAQLVGDPSWNYNNMLPIFKAIENYVGTSEIPAERGTGGPLNVIQNSDPGFSASGNAVAQAISTALDIPAVEDYNLNITNAVSATQRLVKLNTAGNRVRVWGYDLLPETIVDRNGRAVDGRKLTIHYNSTVDKILFEDACNPNRGTHVSFTSYKGVVSKVKANKAIIVAAGVCGTPAVLQRSGIGPLAVLRAAGVEPKIVNENVGTHLKIPIGITTPYTLANFPIFLFSGPIQNQTVMGFDDGHIVGYPQDNLRRYEHLYNGQGGLMAQVATQLGIPLNSPTFWHWYLRPGSEGSVSIVSTDPQILPNIVPNILSNGGLDVPTSDATAMVNIALEARLIGQAIGCPILFPTPSAYAAYDNGDGGAALFAAVRSGWTVTSHYQEYVRMGVSPATSVVDSNLKLWNTNNIYVADMGVAPYSVSGHTALPAFIIGAKLAKTLGYPVVFNNSAPAPVSPVAKTVAVPVAKPVAKQVAKSAKANSKQKK